MKLMYETKVVTDFEEAETICVSIRNFYTGIIGFDTETYHSNLTSDPIDVIQICIPSDVPKEVPKVYIFHVAAWPRIEIGKKEGKKRIPESLSKIISSKRIIKVVSAPENDAKWLWNAFEIRLLGVIDIQSIAMLRGETSYGLENLSLKYLSGWKKTSSNVQMANWSKTLTPEMIEYASNDAYASYALMRTFEPSFGIRERSMEEPINTPVLLDSLVVKSEEYLRKSGLLQKEQKSIQKIVAKILESLLEITDEIRRRETAKVIFHLLKQNGVVSCA